MKMDFIVDKPTKTVSITKEFAFELSLVWDAYTKPELLDQWWAPKPWTSRTKVMDFKVGGRRFYAMVSPEGDERWANVQELRNKAQNYDELAPENALSGFLEDVSLVQDVDQLDENGQLKRGAVHVHPAMRRQRTRPE